MCLFDVGCYDADESSIYRREVRRGDLSHHHAFAEETTATDEIFREELEDDVVDVGDTDLKGTGTGCQLPTLAVARQVRSVA